MSNRNRNHIVVPGAPETEPFTTARPGRSGADRPRPTDRVAHGSTLIRRFEKSWEKPTTEATAEDPQGTLITFISFPGIELAIESLENQGKGEQPELRTVREVWTDEGTVIEATVFIPVGKKRYFLERLEAYVKAAEAGEKKNASLIDGIDTIRKATIRQLWTDPDDQFPSDESRLVWWEVWLRNYDGKELSRLEQTAKDHRLRIRPHYLGFGDRSVGLLNASVKQLGTVLHALDDIAELRKPREVSSFLPQLYASEQREWVDELLDRVQAASAWAPVVCILDRGVQGNNLLLKHSLSSSDKHVADSAWSHDPVIHTHGTEMAGLALYGDLEAAVVGSHDIKLHHRLESVKLLPDNAGNSPELYGAITAKAVDQPEITAQQRKRVFMLAITAPEDVQNGTDVSAVPESLRESGSPTSWSATIDALAYGRAIDDQVPHLTYLDRDEPRTPRLFVISAGNIRDIATEIPHLERSDAEAVEDPAQAWNAITVGAFADKDDMSGAPDSFNGYIPIAQRGELSPSSRTSVSFNRKRWPVKPDVVADGGNLASSSDGSIIDTPPNLGVLTTRHQKFGNSDGFFTTTRDTSAATAQVAAIAAGISSAYPNLKPETVRALIVHSAEWSDAMLERFKQMKTKTELVNLLRRYGMGVPGLDRAIYSASDALTLIDEATIKPFEREGQSNAGKTREMNLHRLPWPKEQLELLGETPVKLRVTLSYFVEPNPSNRGWSGRYAYPSHGLRFEIRRPEESIGDFRKRINKRARLDGDSGLSLKTDSGWLFGAEQQQAPGSLHTDIWRGQAAQLAAREAIAIYPVTGWWKHRSRLDQSDLGVDYSLIVSIEAPETEVDLWTPVAQQIGTVIEV